MREGEWRGKEIWREEDCKVKEEGEGREGQRGGRG